MFENVNHLIFVSSRDCNLRCAYCFEDNKDAYAGDAMSFETLKKIIEKIRKDKARNIIKNKRFDFSFHGGEPMLLGPEKTLQFINYIKQNLPDLDVSFSMQSNISLISPAWYPLLTKHIHLGISFDGFYRRNNLNRIRGNFIQNNIQKIKENDIDIGFVMVLQKNNIKDFMSNAFRLFRQYGSVKANMVENITDERNVYPEITSTEYFQHAFVPTVKHFLATGIFLEHNIRSIIINFCENYLFNNPPRTGICNLKFCGGGTNMLQVEPDGKVSFCQRWSDKSPEKVIGNILEPMSDPWGLPTLLRSFKLQLRKIHDIRKLECDSCIAQSICQYGCLSFALNKYKGKKTIRPDLVCDFYKKAVLYLYKRRSDILLTWAFISNYKSAPSYSKQVLHFELPENKLVNQNGNIEYINDKPILTINLQDLSIEAKLRYNLHKFMKFIRVR